MTEDPITAPEETEADAAARLMLEHGFRHLPVVDDGGRVTGVISLRRCVAATNVANPA